MLKCAPEAFLRRVVQPAVTRHKRGRGWVGANGMPPPMFTIQHGDHQELVAGSANEPHDVRPIDQLVVVDSARREHHIRLFPEMTVAHLRAKIEELGVTPSGPMFLHADEATSSKYVALLKELRPGAPIAEAEGLEKGVHRVAGRATFTFHADYWRAVAKIAFHYYLLNTRRGLRGDEPVFADLRRFILEGGDSTPFFSNPPARFELPFRKLPDGSAILPDVWAHVLAADESRHTAVAMVSLFMGPQRLAPTQHITLGRFSSPLVAPSARWAHAYLYDASQNATHTAGRVVAKSVTQLR
jgi:hypothetical protein